MPLSEFYRMAKLKLESSQQKPTCSTDPSSAPDNEFCELVWENGQIIMQGQSARTRKSHNSSPHAPRLHDKAIGTATTSKMGNFGTMESIINDIPMLVPSGEMPLNQDDDMVPWLNYPVDDDTLQRDYCSEFLPEISGVTVNELSNQSSFALIDKRKNCNQIVRDSQNVYAHNVGSLEHGNASKVSSSRTGQLYPWLLQESQTSVLSLGSGVSEIISNDSTRNSQQAVCEDSLQGQTSSGALPSTKMKKQDSGVPSSGTSLLNFSHFSRPAALVRANLQNISDVAATGSSGMEMMGNMNKGSASSSRSPSKLTLIDPTSSSQKKMGFHNQPNLVSAKVDSKSLMARPPEVSHHAEQSDTLYREDAIKNDKSTKEVLGASLTNGVSDGEKTVEPVLASSSACSGNSAERASNDLTKNVKRKCRDTDESECRSGDIEEESVGAKKAASGQRGTGSKRSRAAEVHNLSERRRRDRINEKMRALQELIPNCNKVDKASMLDEAIEYLKTLQLQVQIMSMGAGMYMPPMMLPSGMQHMPTAHMPPFSQMGIGVGMGFGMGMVDINGGSPGCPMIPVPHIQGAHFPSPPIYGPSGFQGLARSNLQLFGHPGQGLPISVHRAPFVPLPGRPPINLTMGLNAMRMASNMEFPNAASTLNSKDLMQNANSQMFHNADVSSSMNPTSSQFQATKESYDQPALVQKHDQELGVSGSVAVNSANANDTIPSKTSGCD